jgi:hypothetical protein
MASGPLSSFKSLVEYLRTLSLSHVNVKQFTFGQLSDLDIETNKQYPVQYPLVMLIPRRADMDAGGKVEFSFALSVQDITNYDLDIEEDQLNTTFMILQDLLSRIRQTTWDEVDVMVETPIVCRPFVESFNNNLTGWSAEVVFVVKNPFNNCDAAFAS